MTELTDLSETDADNILITGANVAEGCPPSGINNAIRNMAGLIRRAFKTSIFRLRDSTDQTKLLAFDLSGLTTATTRTLTAPDASGTIALTDATSAKTGAYTVLTADRDKTILCDATSAAFTVTLPAAATAGDGFVVTVVKTDSTANAVTIDGSGSETINGATTKALFLQYQAVTLICNGTSWAVQSNFSEWTELAAVATTSGTEKDWTGIPAGVTDIELWLTKVSGNSTDDLLVQIGTGGSPTTSGYSSGSGVAGSNARESSEIGFVVFSNTAANVMNGCMRLHRTGSNDWSSEHALNMSVGVGEGSSVVGGGSVSLGGALDNIRFRSLGGSQTFDGGSVQIRYR